MQSIKFVGFGLAFAFSGIMASYLTSEDVMLPRIVFIISFFLSLSGVIQCMALGKDLEQNEHATVKDKEILIFEK